MQPHTRCSRIILGLLALGVLAGSALTASPAQAASGIGPFFPEPAWARKLPAATRFLVLTDWNNAAVLDKETGLVWERTPDTLPQAWIGAKFACLNRTVSNRSGWRLPSIVELTSLVNPSVITGPTLPMGHPFVGIQSTLYWSATTDSEFPTNAFFVVFSNGGVGGGPKTDVLPVWCVRGGMHAGAY
jgi:hypothetical protein